MIYAFKGSVMMKINKGDEGKNKKDLIVKIILIIIIILLLIHNCMLITRKKNGKTPSGNVNIIEITCEDSDKCDVIDRRDSSNKIDVENDDDSDGGISGTNEGSTKSTGSSGNSKKSSSNSTGNSSSGGSNNNGNSSSGSDDTTTTDLVEEPDGELFVRDKKLVWEDSSDLKIFTNPVYNFEEKIAPESSNTYQFIVKNSTSYKIKYSISFVETNPYNINMKYKLKKNNSYIVDHYVSYNELNISDQLLNAKSNDTFYLDWKWISSDNDTNAGKNQANYSLKIDVEAESVDG